MSPESRKYQLITRSDMDGLVCAILLKQLGMIDEIKFVHPKDVQDGKVEINENHITTNLPYVNGVHMAFDHHASELIRLKTRHENHIIDPHAPSTARVVYQYFGGRAAFPNISDDMMVAVDKADSAQFTAADVLYPKDWELLSFVMDPRTGLGRFKEFTVSNYSLMMKLIDFCQEHKIDEILNLPDVKERVDLYFEHQDQFKEQIRRCSSVYNNLVVLDLRNEDTIFAGNRFMIYALNPRCNISIHILWGVKRQNTVFAVGKSIFNRTSKTNIGELMLKYEGGGHENAGTCQIDNDHANQVLDELIKALTSSD